MVRSSQRRKRQTPAEQAKNRVKELRLELGMTRVELAKLASLSDKTIDRIERGEQRFRETTGRKIFNALNKIRLRDGLESLVYADLFPSQPPRSPSSR